MSKRLKMAACILICALGMGCIRPSCPFLRLSAPERTESPDGRVCHVVTGQAGGRLSDAAMRAWLRQAFAAYDAPMTVEWKDSRLLVASGFSPLVGETLPGASINLQGWVRYDAARDVTRIMLGYPALPTEEW